MDETGNEVIFTCAGCNRVLMQRRAKVDDAGRAVRDNEWGHAVCDRAAYAMVLSAKRPRRTPRVPGTICYDPNNEFAHACSATCARRVIASGEWEVLLREQTHEPRLTEFDFIKVGFIGEVPFVVKWDVRPTPGDPPEEPTTDVEEWVAKTSSRRVA